MRKQFKDIDIYAGIKAQDGAKWIKDKQKKTLKGWNTLILQLVFLLTSVVHTQ